MDIVFKNLSLIKNRIALVAIEAEKKPEEIVLVAVSKNQPVESIREAIKAGHTCFGENRVQEAKAKYVALRKEFPNLELHMIGRLQTNKAVEAVRLFDVIETVDRPKLAAAIADAINKEGKKPRLYIEVNIGKESQKGGVEPEKFPDFLRQCKEEYGLEIDGVMCIPPENENPEPYFRKMKKIADEHNLKNVSMGMSNDFETAIKCGATEVRIGTAIFGKRTY